MWKTYTGVFVSTIDGPKWKRIARRLRSKYRTELAMERAAHKATKQALIAIVRELSEAVGRFGVDDSKWDELAKKDMS